jgi:hypothetical protein
MHPSEDLIYWHMTGKKLREQQTRYTTYDLGNTNEVQMGFLECTTNVKYTSVLENIVNTCNLSFVEASHQFLLALF